MKSGPRVLIIHLAALGLSIAAAVQPALAARDIELETLPTSGQLDDLTRQLGACLYSPVLEPAESLGAGRVELGPVGTRTEIDSGQPFWRITSGGGKRSENLLMTSARVRLGLPAGLDIGASYGRGTTNVRTRSGEIKWAFIPGGTAKPALALRAAYGRMDGVDTLSLRGTVLDVSISKGLGPLTPYAGVGRLWFSSRAHDIPAAPGTRLKSSPGANHVFAGARVSLGWFRAYLEAQRAAGLSSYSLMAAFKFP